MSSRGNELWLLNIQVVSGIAMPSGSDKLYTGSTDETVRVWDCQSGQVVTIVYFVLFVLFASFSFKYIYDSIWNVKSCFCIAEKGDIFLFLWTFISQVLVYYIIIV